MGTELIMGMEEVINYLKELEEKNKKLQEDLKTQTTRADAWEKHYYSKCEVHERDMYRVKEEINQYKNESCESLVKEQKLYGQLFQFQEENKKLKEEVNDLNQEINDRVVIEDIADLFGCADEGDKFDWDSEIGGMILDNKKLKEENKKLKEDLKEELGETQMANKELWRQVVNLHARLDCLPDNIKWIPEARHGGGVWTFSDEESD